MAERVIEALLGEVRAGKDTRFSPKTPGGVLYLAQLVMRFAAELTPEVGAPFVVRMLAPSGASRVLRLEMHPSLTLQQCEDRCAPLFAPTL